MFESISNPQSQAAYLGSDDESSPGPDGKSSEQPWRDADLIEITHIAYIASGNWEKCWKGPIGHALKETAANAIFFVKIAIQDSCDNHITVQLCVLAHLLASFGYELASSLQKQRQLAFLSYHEMPTRSTHQ